MKVKIFIGDEPGFEVGVIPEQTLEEITDVIKQVKRNEFIRMSPDFIKDKGWKMAASLAENGVLDGHALAFDIADPNAEDEEEYYDEEEDATI